MSPFHSQKVPFSPVDAPLFGLYESIIRYEYSFSAQFPVFVIRRSIHPLPVAFPPTMVMLMLMVEWIINRIEDTLVAVRLIRTKEQDQDETRKVEREPKHCLRILPGMSFNKGSSSHQPAGSSSWDTTSIYYL